MPGAIAEDAVVQIEGLIKRYNDREALESAIRIFQYLLIFLRLLRYW